MEKLTRAWRLTTALLGRAAGEFFEDGCPQRAAAISYYSLLSLFPLMILIVAIFGVVADDSAARQRVIEFVLDNVPLREDRGRADLNELLSTVTTASGGFGIFGVAGLLVAASAVMGGVRHALNAAWEVSNPRPPLQGKLVDLLLVFATGVVIASSFAMTLVVQFAATLGDPLGAPGALAHDAILLAGRLVPALLTGAVCTAVFVLVPAHRNRLRDVWPGVLVAVLGFEAAKIGFSLYLHNAANYGAVYASLGGVIAFAVFVFVAANLLLLGAEVASEWPGVRDGPPPTPSQEPLRRRLRRGLRSLVVRPGVSRRTGDGEAGDGDRRLSEG
jgi:membrane protein